MARTVPVIATEAPGNYLTAALWMAQTAAIGNWVLGSGSNGPPRFRGYQSTAQSLAAGWNTLTIDTEVYDSDGGHSTTTNTSRYTVQVAGTYLITGTASFADNGTGVRAARLTVNGTAIIGSFDKTVAASAGHSSARTSIAQAVCVVGDYIEVNGYQNSGGALNTSPGTDVACSLSVQWIAG